MTRSTKIGRAVQERLRRDARHLGGSDWWVLADHLWTRNLKAFAAYYDALVSDRQRLIAGRAVGHVTERLYVFDASIGWSDDDLRAAIRARVLSAFSRSLSPPAVVA